MDAEKNEKKTKSPFKDVILFEKEIQSFANKYKTIVSNQSKRISDYFEMSCFNYVVRFYELQGYKVNIKNLQKGKYRYKCSPAGIQSNFSYFEIVKTINDSEYTYEIQHNLAVQSSHNPEIFTTPDIVIVKSNKIKSTTEYYSIKRTFSYIENENLMSFCEVKNFNPFPELLFNFIGTLNELRKGYLTDDITKTRSKHIAPSLMISGKPNKSTTKIKESLEERYCINLIYDLFYSATTTFAKINIDKLKIIPIIK